MRLAVGVTLQRSCEMVFAVVMIMVTFRVDVPAWLHPLISLLILYRLMSSTSVQPCFSANVDHMCQHPTWGSAVAEDLARFASRSLRRRCSMALSNLSQMEYALSSRVRVQSQ